MAAAADPPPLALAHQGKAAALLLRLLLLAVAAATATADLPYRFEYPTDYNIRLLCNPCKFDDDPTCCKDSYGAMEYFEAIDPVSATISMGQSDAICQFDGAVHPVECLIDADGTPIAYTDARTPDWTIALDLECTGEGDPRYDCNGLGTHRMRFRVEDETGLSTLYPKCIDNNDTIKVTEMRCGGSARSDDPTAAYCMDLAFSQNNYVFECRGLYQDDPTCGTFVELHRSGDNESYIINEARVPAGINTGYNMIDGGLSLRYMMDGSTTIDYVDQLRGGVVVQETMLTCKGQYELWWVLRTRYQSVVQYKKSFEVVSPECDWDTEESMFLPYALERNA